MKASILETAYLQLLTKDHMLLIPSSDGKDTFENSTHLFPMGLDEDTEIDDTDASALPTSQQIHDVYELRTDGDFRAIFSSISSNLDELCLTQAQIMLFAEWYTPWLKPGGNATFFLYKRAGQYRVALIYNYPLGLSVSRHPFDSPISWSSKYALRVVVPRTAKKSK